MAHSERTITSQTSLTSIGWEPRWWNTCAHVHQQKKEDPHIMRVCHLKRVHALETRPTCLEEADDAIETTHQMRAIRSGLGRARLAGLVRDTSTSNVNEPHTTRRKHRAIVLRGHDGGRRRRAIEYLLRGRLKVSWRPGLHVN
jgi:hypothetical protein